MKTVDWSRSKDVSIGNFFERGQVCEDTGKHCHQVTINNKFTKIGLKTVTYQFANSIKSIPEGYFCIVDWKQSEQDEQSVIYT